MAAQYVIVSPVDGVRGNRFAVAADDTTARYIFYPANTAIMTDDRLKLILETTETTPPNSPEDWTDLALVNMMYVSCGTAVPAPSLDEAVTAARQALAAQE